MIRAKPHLALLLLGFVAVLAACQGAGLSQASETRLPERDGPVPQTTERVPHIQIGAEPVPALSGRLLARVSKLPGVQIRDTVLSLPGASGFWLTETVTLTRPEAIVGGREFAHLHPDGSLHASLPPARARVAVEAGWAELHPWAKSRPGWDGFVLLFTPRTDAEADVVFSLIVDGYSYVTGRKTVASDL